MECLRTKSSFILHLYRVKMITIMESLNTKYIVMTLVKKNTADRPNLIVQRVTDY